MHHDTLIVIVKWNKYELLSDENYYRIIMPTQCKKNMDQIFWFPVSPFSRMTMTRYLYPDEAEMKWNESKELALR